MKRVLLIILLFCGVLTALKGGSAQQIEKRLKMSSAGLPEFRVEADLFGVIRSVRTLPGPKVSGAFKLSALAGYPGISMLDISGVESVDLEGLSKFKELRSLRIGAAKVSGLEKSSLPGLIRLDIANTSVADISWLRNFPGVRILHLPESVTNISVLKGRSFRALSVPGVTNSDDVCRTLGIKVSIRTAHAYRRPGRDTMPPLALKRDAKGAVVSAVFMRFNPPRRKAPGFVGEMFPEELAPLPVPPKPEEYPGLSAFSRREPFKVSLFAGERASLRRLDLRALNSVVFSGESFPALEELCLSGEIINLESLNAPKLKKLVLENIEGSLPGGTVAPRRFRHFTLLPPREGAKPVRLGSFPALESLKITLLRNEFDFDSIKNVKVKKLECRFYGKDLSFLKGGRINKLSLYAPFVTGSKTAVLGSLPLKELKLALNNEADCRFLQKLRLRRLTLSGGKNFSISLIRKMPLTALCLKNTFDTYNDLNSLKIASLQELVLDQVNFTRVEFLGRLTNLKSLALENCVYSPEDLNLREPDLDYVCGDRISKEILKMKKLQNLRIGQIGVFTGTQRIVNYDFPWERFKALDLVNFSLCAERADFAKEYKALKRLKVDDISRHGISPDQVRTGKILDTLVLTNARPRPDRAVPERNSFFRRPVTPAPGKEPGVAHKVYLHGPGGFNGGFLY